MTYQEWDTENRENITETFGNLSLKVNSIERLHPNGEYKIEVDPVFGLPLFTSGYAKTLETTLEAKEFYLYGWVVYPEYLSFLVRTWKEE